MTAFAMIVAASALGSGIALTAMAMIVSYQDRRERQRRLKRGRR